MSDDYKVDMYSGHPLIIQLNEHFKSIQDIVDQGIPGPPGEDGADGTDGDNGWTPVIAIESDMGGRYMKVIDWTGGTGTKPAVNLYVTETGLEATIDNAINIRGPQGEQGEQGDSGSNGQDGTDGVGLVFNWDGTQLGVAREDDFFIDAHMQVQYNYQYVDLEGPEGPQGIQGEPGEQGEDGVGVPAGGATGQVLAKASGDDYDTEWIDQTGGGGGGSSTFIGLTDTPSSYTGEAGQVLAVNASENGVEFIDPPSGGGGGSVESGTWTPTLQVFSGTYTVQDGFYFKVGDWVYLFGRIGVAANSPSTNIRILGTPYLADTTNNMHQKSPFTLYPTNSQFPTGNTDSNIGGYFFNANQIRFYNQSAGGISTGGESYAVEFNFSGWFKTSGAA